MEFARVSSERNGGLPGDNIGDATALQQSSSYYHERDETVQNGGSWRMRAKLPTRSEGLDLEQLVGILRRRWWVIALMAVLVGASTLAISAVQQKEYTATASVLFQNQQVNQLQASGLQATAATPSQDPQAMATNIQLLTQQAGIADATAKTVGHGLTAASVARSLSVSQQDQTNIANVSATTSDPSLAAMVANTYVAQFIASQSRQQRATIQQGLDLVERQIAALSPQQLAGASGQALLDRAESLRVLARLQNGGVQQVKPAKPPTAPSSPRIIRNVVLGLLIGVLLGLGMALLLERLDRRIRDVDDLESSYRLPVLAAIPYNRAYALPPQPDATGVRHEKEVFSLLRAYLRYFNVDRELRILLVTSAAPGDGKSTIAHNLAEAAQESGTKTLLLEADMRRSSLALHYNLDPVPGLSDLLIGGATMGNVIRSVPISTRVNGARSQVALDVLVAGHPPPNPVELLESQAMTDVLAWAKEHYELVVVDTPPMVVVSDAIPLLRKVDGVVLVSQLSAQTRDTAALVRERLFGMSAPVLGIVANGVKTKRDGRYGYGYGDYAPDRNERATRGGITLR